MTTKVGFRNAAGRGLGGAVPFLICSLILTVAGSSARAADFPPVTDAEKSLTKVAGTPNARGVVIFHKGEFQMLDFSKEDPASRLSIQGRIKILTEEGKSLGELEIPYSGQLRLSGFSGRTVLPDGTVVPVAADAKFERRLSKRSGYYAMAIAFPAVQPGAILDYRYDLYFDSIYLLEPWYFTSELPTLHSEVVYLIPKPMAVQTWRRDPFQVNIQLETGKAVQGTKVRAWADNTPPVPDEPFQLPYRDMAAQIVMLPTRWTDEFVSETIMETWAATSDLLNPSYDEAIRKDGDADKKAAQIAAAAGTSQREQAAAIFRFVRDKIEFDGGDDVIPTAGHNAGETLKRGSGDSVDKALLLVAMLRSMKVKARPVWASRRDHGLIDPNLASPEWFTRMLVAADLEGGRVYLDPSDRTLAFGQLPAAYEGTAGLIPDRKKPEGMVLPEAAWDQNGQHAALKLEIDPKGVVKGSGTLTLTGHHAGEFLFWKEDAEKTAMAWKEWLGDRQKDFTISGVQVKESADDRKVEVQWAMTQREEEALGNEVTLQPSRPLGPAHQPFVLPTSQRRSPILFEYGDRDDMEVEIHWPEGWKVEALPKGAHSESPGLAFNAEVIVQTEARTLVYKRHFDISKKQFGSRDEVETVRAMFDLATKSDAEALVLAHR